MSPPLAPCPSCSRHVRARVCPFCGAACEPGEGPAPRPRMNRAAMVLGVGIVATGPMFDRLLSCNATPAPAYGAPVVVTWEGGGPPPVAVYGAPPIMPTATPPDASTPDAGAPDAAKPKAK